MDKANAIDHNTIVARNRRTQSSHAIVARNRRKQSGDCVKYWGFAILLCRRTVRAAYASWLEGFEPVLSPEAKVDENGVLLLAGLYQTNPNILFEQKYVNEGVAWKRVGFSFQAK